MISTVLFGLMLGEVISCPKVVAWHGSFIPQDAINNCTFYLNGLPLTPLEVRGLPGGMDCCKSHVQLVLMMLFLHLSPVMIA